MYPEFSVRVGQALGNERLRRNIRRTMDGLIEKRRQAFPDSQELTVLRRLGKLIRGQALANLPDLLLELETNCERNGIRVHWAETAAEANAIVLDLLRRHGAEMVIKGKSMVSEEMGLNHYLEAQGIQAVETDLGEFILQLAGERPSHIIAPAIHKDRREIAALFAAHYPEHPYTEDIEGLTAIARRIMREHFGQAVAGLSGVNFAVAETGTLCLVENEGNGRLCTTAPDIHIAVCGIEKVIARLDQLPPLLTLLTRSATGQPITTYVNLISGPRREGELDGPREVHLVLLDNGRSRIHQDSQLKATLRCIRCGACMNHCPVYTRLSGHAYGTVYPGPIGSILEPQLQGLDHLGELADASSLCGACGEACPVRIPLPGLLRRLRAEGVMGLEKSRVLGRGSRRKPLHRLVWTLWRQANASPALYRLMTVLATRLRRLIPTRLGPWSRTRVAPEIASRSLHELARADGFSRD
ncbi:MAG: iron-sulfur cluster-binding protein [Gammaproteobacteria bacterium]|nr:MAG: iron-sulfur cluster-binding protein [Gammaproteobacteria bacterium]